MYQSFTLEAQANTIRCGMIVILLVHLKLEEGSVLRANQGGGDITPPNISTALDFPKMCVEMISDQK